MKIEDVKKVLIIGSGTMGQMIGFQCAIYDYDVVLYDIKDDILKKAMDRIERLSNRFVQDGKLSKEKAGSAIGRIKTTTDQKEAALDADFVVENVPEDPKLKGKIFSDFNKLCPGHTIFTTNTSTLLPSMFAEATGRPDRFAAFHFHDIRITNIVDVMPHPGTSPETMELIRQFAIKINQLPIMMKKENSGYVFNAMVSALFIAAQTLASKGIASYEDIDRAWMGVLNVNIGPFGMMDSVGIDTVHKITEYWALKNNNPGSIKNAEFLKKWVEKGDLGQKSGKGFYTYPNPKYADPDFTKKIE